MPPLIFKRTAQLKSVTKKKRVEQQPMRSVSTQPFEGGASQYTMASMASDLGDTGRFSVDVDRAGSTFPGGDAAMPRDMWRRWAMDTDGSRHAGWTRVSTAVGENGQSVDGTLSKWTTRPLPEQVAELFNVAYNEETGRFEHSLHLAATVSSLRSEGLVESRARADRVFDNVSDNRTKLGMSGRANMGPTGDMVPETLRDKLLLTGTRPAPGPIRTAITERERRVPLADDVPPTSPSRHAMAREYEDLALDSNSAQAGQARRPGLVFDYICPDPYENDTFYFTQRGKETPQRNGSQKWQLRCVREKVWKSAAPRAYGPSRDRGGFWGGGCNTFTTRTLIPSQNVDGVAGGGYVYENSFFLSVVDEVSGGDANPWVPQFIRKFAPQRIATLGSLRPQVEAEHDRPGNGRERSQVWVPRTATSGGNGGTSYLRMVPAASGFPKGGYPGWGFRELGPRAGTALPGESRETTMKRINTATVSFAEQPFEEGEEGGASTTTAMTRARALPARLNVDTPALRVALEAGRSSGRASVELKGSGGGVYPRAGGPNSARAQRESWRMPFTQAGDLRIEDTADDTLYRFSTKSAMGMRRASVRDPAGNATVEAMLATGAGVSGYSGLAREPETHFTHAMKDASLWRPPSRTRPLRGWSPARS